jgi:hypothetical protein
MVAVAANLRRRLDRFRAPWARLSLFPDTRGNSGRTLLWLFRQAGDSQCCEQTEGYG